jgi:hypothetical protein
VIRMKITIELSDSEFEQDKAAAHDLLARALN